MTKIEVSVATRVCDAAALDRYACSHSVDYAAHVELLLKTTELSVERFSSHSHKKAAAEKYIGNGFHVMTRVVYVATCSVQIESHIS